MKGNSDCNLITTDRVIEVQWYSTSDRSLYCQVICCVPVSCKAYGVGKQLGAWRYSDLLVILYLLGVLSRSCATSWTRLTFDPSEVKIGL